MAQPLFSEKKVAQRKKELDGAYNRNKSGSHEERWAEHEAVERAQQIESNRRVRARADEFLNALIILAGSRGVQYVNFPECFELSDSKEMREALSKYDTPEARRTLHTILKALTEIPKSWAMSAFIRFLRGQGKQKGLSKYYGSEMFSVQFGWKGEEITQICRVIADGHNPYSLVLMSYSDVAAEIRQENPDYAEVEPEVEYRARFEAVKVERDVEFLNKLCEMLEKRGLAPVPTPKPVVPKKEHVPKAFKPNDTIRTHSIRDLPLPALVRVPIERCGHKEDQWNEANWKQGTMDQVVMRIGNSGHYYFYVVNPETGKAHSHDHDYFGESKEYLNGATFLKKWRGEISEKKLAINFRFRLPKKNQEAA